MKPRWRLTAEAGAVEKAGPPLGINSYSQAGRLTAVAGTAPVARPGICRFPLNKIIKSSWMWLPRSVKLFSHKMNLGPIPRT